MQKFIVIAAFAALAIIKYSEAIGNHPPTEKWEDFKAFHGKSYKSDTHEALHKSIYQKNAAAVAKHNEDFRQGKVSYTKELNQFADIDPKEFVKRNGLIPPPNIPNSPRSRRSISKRQVPSSLNYTAEGKVSPVKDQGQCGSCWSFSTTGAMEAQVLILNREAQTFSEQDLVSCDSNGNDHGCNGGFYSYAWSFIQSQGGIPSDSTYQYTSGDTQQTGTCSDPSNSTFVANVATFNSVGNDVDSMKAALVQYGPLSIALDAQDWQLASDGIYSCNQTNIDHAVLLTGYGTDNDGNDYWIVKNSWGTGWGDQGYLLLSQTAGEDCGVTSNPYYVQIQ